MDFHDHDDAEEEEEEEEEEEDDDLPVPPVAPAYHHLPPTPIMPNSTAPKPLNSAPGPEPMSPNIPRPAIRKTPSGSSATGGRYRECLKNHAVGIGGHAVDGCGEFMAAGEEGTIDALRCAACNCHCNFHRKENDGPGVPGPSSVPPGAIVDPSTYQHPHPQFSPYYRTPAGYLHHHHMAAAAAAAAAAHRPVPLALPSTSGGGGQSRDELEDVSHPMGMMGLGGSGSGGVMMMGMGMGMGASGSGSGSGSGKKRFRTKFTQEQKDKMLAFAEKVGWRIQKHDEQAVQQFCNEVAVKRHVLKVWMHNNKHTLGKKP